MTGHIEKAQQDLRLAGEKVKAFNAAVHSQKEEFSEQVDSLISSTFAGSTPGGKLHSDYQDFQQKSAIVKNKMLDLSDALVSLEDACNDYVF